LENVLQVVKLTSETDLKLVSNNMAPVWLVHLIEYFLIEWCN